MNNLLDRIEANPRPTALRLSGEQRFVDPFLNFEWNPRPRIDDLKYAHLMSRRPN